MRVDLQWMLAKGRWFAVLCFPVVPWHGVDEDTVHRTAQSALHPLSGVGRFGASPESEAFRVSEDRCEFQFIIRGVSAIGSIASDRKEPNKREREAAAGFGLILDKIAPKHATGDDGHGIAPADPASVVGTTPSGDEVFRTQQKLHAYAEMDGSATHSQSSAIIPSKGTADTHLKKSPNIDYLTLRCPACSVPLHEGVTRCSDCNAEIHGQAVPCPVCATSNLIVLDDEERPCRNRSCGEYLSAARLLGRLPSPVDFLDALRATSKMAAYQVRRTLRGERRVDYVDSKLEEPAVVFLAPTTLLNDPPPHEVARERMHVPFHVLLPSDVRRGFLDEQSLLYYRVYDGGDILSFDKWSKEQPKETLTSFLAIVQDITHAGYWMPALLPEDLAIRSGRVIIRHGHRLVAETQPIELSTLLPWDPDSSLEPEQAEFLRAVLLWYHSTVGDLLGLRADDADLETMLLSPRTRAPQVPVGTWAAVQPMLLRDVEWTISDALDVLRWEEAGTVVRCDGYTDVGEKRDGNQEDRFGIFELPTGTLCVVADGVSRSGWGEIAAELVVKAFKAAARKDSLDAIPSALVALVQDANDEIGRHILGSDREQAEAEGQFGASTCMSSTALAAFVRPDRAVVVSLGDSPCLLVRRRGIEVATVEHSQRVLDVRNGMEVGRAWKREGATSLENYVGSFEFEPDEDEGSERIDPGRPHDIRPLIDVMEISLRNGDVLLLCSDGVTDFLALGEIRDVVLSEVDMGRDDLANRIVCSLVTRAVSRQPTLGGDNVTAIAVAVSDDEAESARATSPGDVHRTPEC